MQVCRSMVGPEPWGKYLSAKLLRSCSARSWGWRSSSSASPVSFREVLAELEARHAEDGKAVKATFVHEQIEDGEVVGPEEIRPFRLQPGEDLPLRHGEAAQDVEKIGVPGAGGHNETVGLVGAAVCTYAHTSLQRYPLEDPLVAVYLGTKGLCRHHVGDDAPLRREESSLRLE